METANSDDLRDVQALAQRVLDAHATPERLKTLLDRPGRIDDDLWNLVAEQGWIAAPLPVEAEGLGLGWRGLCVLAQETGRLTVSLPLAATSLCAHVAADRLPGLASGGGTACLALAEPGESGLPERPAVTFANGGLRGRKALAPFAAAAGHALVSADDGAGPGLFLVALDRAGVARAQRPSIDDSRAAAALSFEDAPAERLGGADLLAEVTGIAALAAAFEQVGGAQASLEIACAYAKERYAFGQPIGQFQGIKHKLAEVYGLVQLARGCALDALDAWEQADASRFALVAAARLAATEAYDQAAKEAIQVQGGMGVTWEAMPHHHYRRARVLAVELGSAGYWRERLLALVLDDGHAGEAP